MSYVVSLQGFTPSPRYDGHSFTTAVVAEGDNQPGPFTPLQEFTLDTTEENPEAPRTRNFTVTTAAKQYGAWYEVSFVDPEGNREVLTPVPGPVAPLPIDVRRQWLARILQNAPRVQTETLVGDGTSTVFTLREAPAANPPLALRAGATTYVLGRDYNFNPLNPAEIIFAIAPASGLVIQARYFQTVWPEAELAYYITEAENQYSDPMGVVYQAAILGIDAVLLGLATALNFGSGEESYDMQSVFTRVTELRGVFDQWLVERQDEGAPITVTDVYGDDIGAGDAIQEIEELDPLNWYNP